MKVNVNNAYYKKLQLSKLLTIRHGITEMFDSFKDWKALISLTDNPLDTYPYRFQLRNIRECFWENISFVRTDRYFIERHRITLMKKTRENKTGFQITIFDKISRNCFKRHPDIRYRFWILIKEGWHIFIYHFSRWYLLIQMGDGTDGYPNYNEKMTYSRDLFFYMLSKTLPTESLVIPYDREMRKK